MKALKAAVLLVVVLGIIAAGASSLWLGRAVKAAVERYGPGIVGAPVTAGTVILKPWSGHGSISSLVIGNPPGFNGPRALSVGSIEVKIKLSSFASGTIVVESVVVRDPEILYEMGSGGSNLAQLQRSAEGAGKKSDPKKDGGKGLFIRDLSVTGAKVGVSASGLGAKGVTIPLPDIKMSNLGGEGRSPAAAVAEVLRELGGKAGKAVMGLGKKAFGDAAASVMDLFKGKK